MPKHASAQTVQIEHRAIKLQQGPYKNKFIASNVRIITDKDGTQFVACKATCTADSDEPGRVYFCTYELRGNTGVLSWCETDN